MTARQSFLASAAVLAAAFSGSAAAQPPAAQYVQVAQIEIDPVQLEEYRASVREQITAAIRDEPGVLVLYAISDKDNPARVTVFEINAPSTPRAGRAPAPPSTASARSSLSTCRSACSSSSSAAAGATGANSSVGLLLY